MNIYYENKFLSNNKIILYLSIFLVTVLVFCISSTYAFFVAGNSNNTTITGSIANTNVNVIVTKLTNGTAADSSLTPFNLLTDASSTFANDKKTLINTALSRGCISSEGYTACHAYKISVTTSDSLNLTGDVKITLKSGTNIDNVKWTLLNYGSNTDYGSLVSTSGITSSIYNTGAYSPVNYNTNGIITRNTSNGNATYDVINGTYYYFILVWLEETDSSIQYDNGEYVGTVTFSGSGNSGHVSATFA